MQPRGFGQAISLKGQRAVLRVHESAFNGKSDLTDFLRNPSFFQCTPSAVTERQVDTSTAFYRTCSRIRSALIHINTMTALGQHQRP